MAARPRRILVGYDGSSASRRALDAVADLAGYGSTVAVVAAPAGDKSPGELRRLIDEARDVLLRRHVAARCFAAEGAFAESLADVARNLDVDLIVVARPSEAAATAVDTADCDVLVVA